MGAPKRSNNVLISPEIQPKDTKKSRINFDSPTGLGHTAAMATKLPVELDVDTAWNEGMEPQMTSLHVTKKSRLKMATLLYMGAKIGKNCVRLSMVVWDKIVFLLNIYKKDING